MNDARAQGGHGFDLLVVGLTGGIASGKSTVSAMLEALGIPVIDADRLAREVVEPGRPAFAEVVAAFGPEVVAPDGRLDRARLGAIVFADPAARARLEAIVHPRVFEAERARLAEIARRDPGGVAVVDAALLLESGNARWMDAVVLVAAPRETQIERLVGRRGLSRAEAEARVAAQWPLERKRALADYEIDNGGSLESTRRQVAALAEALRERARARAVRAKRD
ncbi:MAG TPA: dephospho-CoA kinase [Thermodesulfobacteriota bacterium]